MTYKLLPCPRCGGEATISDGGYSGEKFLVRCSDLSCPEASGFIRKTHDEAIAAWNSRADARQLALKTKVCPMCEDCPDGCPVETPKDSRNIVTNADRIRAMSDEELAEYIFSLGNGPEDCDEHCAYQDECNAEGFNYSICIKACIKRLTDWLKQPVEEE